MIIFSVPTILKIVPLGDLKRKQKKGKMTEKIFQAVQSLSSNSICELKLNVRFFIFLLLLNLLAEFVN